MLFLIRSMKHFAGCLTACMLAAVTVCAQPGHKDSVATQKAGHRPDTTRLKEVIVRPRGNYMEQKIDRIVINVNEPASNAGSNALDILNTLPGMLADENGGISFRGRGGIIVYIDDRPTRLSGAALTSYLKSIPSAQLDKVEIISNPPARYEADGAAGIINIRTKQIKGKNFNGNLSLNYGMGRYFKSNNSLNLSYRKDKLAITGSIGYSASKNFYEVYRQRNYTYPDTAGGYRIAQEVHETNRVQGLSYRLGVDYDWDKHTSFGILLNGSTSPYSETGSYTSQYTDATATTADSVIYSQSRLDRREHRNTVDISFRRLLNTRGRMLTGNLSYLRYTAGGEQTLQSKTWLPSDSLAGVYTLISATPLSADIYGARADYNDNLAAGIKMEMGVQSTWSLRRNRGDYYNKTGDTLYPNMELDNTFRYRENINSAYISFNQSFPHISWQAGLRAEHTHAEAASFDTPLKPDTSFTLNYYNLFPTFYVLYKPDTNGKGQFIFSAGRRISRPGYQSLNPLRFFFDRNTAITGNSLLQPQFSNNLELSYSIGGPVTITLSYSDTKNDILSGYRQVGDVYIATLVNLQRSTSAAINAASTLPVTTWWTINLYGELTRTSFRGDLFGGEMYINRKLVSFAFTGSSQFKAAKGWSADISGNYRGRLLSNQSLREPAWQVNAGIQKKFGDRMTLSLSGRDIFYSWRIKRTVTMPYATVSYDLRNETRQIGLTLTRRFGKNAAARERKTGIQSESERL